MKIVRLAGVKTYIQALGCVLHKLVRLIWLCELVGKVVNELVEVKECSLRSRQPLYKGRGGKSTHDLGSPWRERYYNGWVFYIDLGEPIFS